MQKNSASREKLLLQKLAENPFVLAPMAGITDHSFRSFMKTMGAGIVVSELISSDGIEFKSERTMRLMGFDETQRPVGLQLFGDDPKILARAAQTSEQTGCDFIDLNFGCPVPKVTKKGAGSAMLKDLPQMTEVLREVKKAISIPLTIKIRTGWDSQTRNADEVCNIAFNEGITWVAIHGRTRAQSYSGLSDWDYISEVKSKAKLPVLGNGDIHTGPQAVQRLVQTGVDGVLIGRGCLKNPYIFLEAQHLWRISTKKRPLSENSLEKDCLNSHSMKISTPESLDESLDIDRNFQSVFLELKKQLELRCDDHILGIQLKKFASWFATGYPGAAQFRKLIFSLKSNEEVLKTSLSFFNTMKNASQFDTSQEQFLMGGHG